MKLSRLFVVAVIAVSSLQAIARQSVPVVDVEGPIALTASGEAPTLEQVKQAIFRAAPVHGWAVREAAPGVMLATLDVRGKHMVVTEIRYSAEKYSITLVQSNNLNQGMDKDGKNVIHPSYNKWTHTLSDDIRQALAQP
jgi:hypothetical protein